MASYKILSVKARADASVKLDVYVYPTGVDTEDPETPSIGHFDVVLNAAQVKQAEGMTNGPRAAYLKTLFEADPRITGVVISEEAKALLDGWYTWPITITL